jgi:ribonuclease P protein component
VKQTLSASQRLHDKEIFERTLKTKAFVEKWIAIHVELNAVGFDRLGMIVSKRVVPKASRRNLIKRLIREEFRTSAATSKHSYDLVVKIRKRFLPEETASFRRIMSHLFTKVRNKENDAPNFVNH